MEKDQKKRPENPEQDAAREQNPTLHEPGAKVADYGNVTGGSASENAEQHKSGKPQDNSRSANNDTMGNP